MVQSWELATGATWPDSLLVIAGVAVLVAAMILRARRLRSTWPDGPDADQIRREMLDECFAKGRDVARGVRRALPRIRASGRETSRASDRACRPPTLDWMCSHVVEVGVMTTLRGRSAMLNQRVPGRDNPERWCCSC